MTWVPDVITTVSESGNSRNSCRGCAGSLRRAGLDELIRACAVKDGKVLQLQITIGTR